MARLWWLPLLIAGRASLGALLPDFRHEGPDDDAGHYALGRRMGTTYRDAIQTRMAAHYRTLRSFAESDDGRRVLDGFLASHRRQVPLLVRELEGIADGSGVPFGEVFAVSLTQEVGYFAQEAKQRAADHCSDYTMCTALHCFDAHNEDSDKVDSSLFVASVKLGNKSYTVLNYVGDLLGGMSAFAFNGHGLAFSLNWVGPGSCDTAGLGRNFISRALLDAETWDQAKAIVSQRHAAGHNYQLMDFVHRRIANAEVAHDAVAFREVREPFFHANQYQTLRVPGQILGNSSVHRLARAAELPAPTGPEDALRILGDQHDRLWPVFHDQRSHDRGELSDWTLATVLFDLDAGVVKLMRGNPANLEVQRTFRVPRGARPLQLFA